VAPSLPQRPAMRASVQVWAATLLGFLSVGAVLPVLPRYVKGPVGAGDVSVGSWWAASPSRRWWPGRSRDGSRTSAGGAA
jgi:hypothetical protein